MISPRDYGDGCLLFGVSGVWCFVSPNQPCFSEYRPVRMFQRHNRPSPL